MKKNDEQLELFKLLVDNDKLHPNFRTILDDKLPYVREVLLNWARGFVDRDGKLVREFQTTFNSTFWELYLFGVLKKLKQDIDFTKNRPDFIVKGDEPFCIEATIANSPQNGQEEWNRNYSEEELKNWTKERIVDNSTLRLASSFKAKSNKYINSYAKLDYVKELPYVIAIAPFDSPYFFLQNHQAIRRVLYGFDRYIAVDWNEFERDIIDEVNITEIDKGNGAKVPLGYFNHEEHSHVSAVIFSTVATAGKARMVSDDPRLIISSQKLYNDQGTQPIFEVLNKEQSNEHLLDGLVVFHNPNAIRPFSASSFYHSKIAHFSEEFSDIPHRSLLQREVIVIRNSHGWSKKRKNQKAEEIKKYIFKNMAPNEFPVRHE